MSDFDKEAERERLREKYERDKADREATQRMSELLLKGARMTNTHCDVCGDPFFEQDGVTFCPTCHGSPEGVEAALEEQAEEAQATGAATDASADAAEERTTDASGESDSGGESAEIDVSTPTEASQGAPSGSESTAPAATGDRADERESTRSTDAERPSRSRRRPANAGASSSRTADVSGDLQGAHDALLEALERFAREAARTDDPRYAAECLEAAHEAAEALDALR